MGRGLFSLGWLASVGLAACAGTGPQRAEGTVDYQGSSTVAVFLRRAQPEYGAIEFRLDTAPESEGGEQAIVQGKVDFAGIAKVPESETLLSGVNATLIGRDAIAVVVNEANPIVDLSLSDLQAIFSGEIVDWSELGGLDLPIEPYVMSPNSATRGVFRAAVLGAQEYSGCLEVKPDRLMLDRVADSPGAVGQISFSFLDEAQGVRAVAVDGEVPAVTNFDYPISRPLYLLWRRGSPVIEDFVSWATGEAGQRVVMQDFVGVGVLGSVRGTEPDTTTGTLIVKTETFQVMDGGIFYYPHRPYEVLDRKGSLVRRVRNHRGLNDEDATRVELPPGTYLIRTETSRGERLEYFVTLNAGELTILDILALMKDR